MDFGTNHCGTRRQTFRCSYIDTDTNSCATRRQTFRATRWRERSVFARSRAFDALGVAGGSTPSSGRVTGAGGSRGERVAVSREPQAGPALGGALVGFCNRTGRGGGTTAGLASAATARSRGSARSRHPHIAPRQERQFRRDIAPGVGRGGHSSDRTRSCASSPRYRRRNRPELGAGWKFERSRGRSDEAICASEGRAQRARQEAGHRRTIYRRHGGCRDRGSRNDLSGGHVDGLVSMRKRVADARFGLGGRGHGQQIGTRRVPPAGRRMAARLRSHGGFEGCGSSSPGRIDAIAIPTIASVDFLPPLCGLRRGRWIDSASGAAARLGNFDFSGGAERSVLCGGPGQA